MNQIYPQVKSQSNYVSGINSLLQLHLEVAGDLYGQQIKFEQSCCNVSVSPNKVD